MPKTYFYSDILNEHEKRYTKNFYCCLPAAFKIKSHPAPGVDLSHIFRLKKSVEEKKSAESAESVLITGYSVANGTTLKYACCKDSNLKFKLNNSTLNFEYGYKPSDFNTEEKAL
jgi:hypothetical protein